MYKNEATNLVLDKYRDAINIKSINELLDATNNKDIGTIKAQTVQNIAKWALNGASNEEIARNLEISNKQFETLLAICPTLIMVMKDSRELADVVVAGSLFQRAIGGQIVKKRVPVKVGDYQDGVRIGEHIEMVTTEEELPPDSALLKFLAEHKLSEKFGKDTNDKDKEVVSVINSLDPQQLKELEEEIRKNGK